MPGHLERVQTFVEVVDRGGFAAAARALGVSPSAVTRAVADLESDLGVQLLTRTTRSVSLTQPGRGYLDAARAALAGLGAAEEEVRAAQNTLRGPLRISAPLSFGIRVLPDIAAGFRDLHPDVVLAFDLTDRFVDILNGERDMALRISGPPADKSTIWRKIGTIPRKLVATRGYLAAHGTPETPQDLMGHAMLAYSAAPEGETLTLTRDGRSETVSPRPALAADNGDLLANLAIKGLGIAMLPTFLVARPLARGRLVDVLSDWQPPEIWLTAFYPPYDRLPARVRAFTEYFESRIAGWQEV